MRFETYRKGLAAYATTLLFSNLIEHAFNNELTGFTVTHAVLVLLVASLPLLACLPSSRAWPWAVILWCNIYTLILILWIFRSAPTTVRMDRFRWGVLAVIFLMSMILIFSDDGVRLFTNKLIIIVTIIAIIFNIYEFFNPWTFSTYSSKGRSNGLYHNANRSAAALILGMIIGLGAINRRWQVPFAIATGLGVLVTFTRSAIVGWTFIVLLVFAMKHQVKDLVRYGLIAALFMALLVPVFWSSLLGSMADSGALNSDVEGRAFMVVGDGAQAVTDEARKVAVERSLEIFADHPILGLGTGAAYEPPFDEVGPHNEYLLLMVNHGLLGLFILPALVWATTRGAGRETRAIAIPFAVFITYWSLFSHTILEEYDFLLVFALVASLVAADRTREPVTPGSLR